MSYFLSCLVSPESRIAMPPSSRPFCSLECAEAALSSESEYSHALRLSADRLKSLCSIYTPRAACRVCLYRVRWRQGPSA